MKTTKMSTIVVLALGLMVWSAELVGAAPMGTAFTYQGRLIDANSAAEGLYDFQFKLYDDANTVTGNQVGSDVNEPDLDVIDGYFTLESATTSNADTIRTADEGYFCGQGRERRYRHNNS